MQTSEHVAKRRSSTRVGRKHPRLAPSGPPFDDMAGAGQRATVRRSVTRPRWHEGVIYRLVYGPSEQVEVQEWSAPYWCPSLAPLQVALAASLAPPEVLQSFGVPTADWPGDQALPWEAPALVRIIPTPRSSTGGDSSTGETL